jgi:hypothetical protein
MMQTLKKSVHKKNQEIKIRTVIDQLRNEDGSFVIFTTLMILILLTLTGVMATHISNTEVTIAGNEISRNIILFQAEGGAVEAAMKIEATDDNDLKVADVGLNPNYPIWMNYHQDINSGDLADDTNWDFSGDADDNAAISDFRNDVEFTAIDKGVAAGSSLIMTGGEQKREYQVYGLSDTRLGKAMVEIGYRKRLL